MAIQNFACYETEVLYTEGQTTKFNSIQRTAERKLTILNSASNLSDLRSPVGNNLHALTGDRAGQHAIRINDQYRICFIWTPAGPASVEIVDYH